MQYLKDLFSKLVMLIGKIHWKSKKVLSPEKQDKIRQLLTKDYFIILARRDNHLSTYFINFADFFLTGKMGYWSHAVMNLEDTVDKDEDFRLMEATGVGVHYSPFQDVFNVQHVVLLKPKKMTLDEWTALLDRSRAQLGKPYDTLFNIKDDKALSCVELVRVILQGEPNYETDFANFEALIKKYKELSPQMIYDCGDFDVVSLMNA